MNRKWAEVKKEMNDIRTNNTGTNWREPWSEHKPLTTAQSCRSTQDLNDPERVWFCSRCGHASASYQCHYWQWCRKDSDSLAALTRGAPTVEFHVCCPGSCSLTDPDPDPVQPCHPAPGTYKEWADTRRADAENMAVWRGMVEESEALRKKENRGN